MLWNAAGSAEELPLTHFTPQHQLVPLPSASVQKAIQDSLGYIWLGFFSSGLARYDGHSLELFSGADGLPGPIVREIVEDAQGYLEKSQAMFKEMNLQYDLDELDRVSHTKLSQ